MYKKNDVVPVFSFKIIDSYLIDLLLPSCYVLVVHLFTKVSC